MTVRNSVTFFLKNSFPPIHGKYYRALFVWGSWDLILYTGLNGSLQFLLNWYNILSKVGPKTALLSFNLKKVKHLIRVLEFYWYLIHFNSKIWPMKYCFEGKNMTYEMVQNLARLDNQIKKSTFLPYLARVFGFNSNKKVFNCCNFLIHHPIVLHLFITLFWLWNSRFALFFFEFFWILIFVFTH